MIHRITVNLDGTQTEEFIPEVLVDEEGYVVLDADNNPVYEQLPE